MDRTVCTDICYCLLPVLGNSYRIEHSSQIRRKKNTDPPICNYTPTPVYTGSKQKVINLNLLPTDYTNISANISTRYSNQQLIFYIIAPDYYIVSNNTGTSKPYYSQLEPMPVRGVSKVHTPLKR